MRKTSPLIALLFVGVAAFLFIGVYFPRPEADQRTRKLYCAQTLQEQVAKTQSIYEATIIHGELLYPGAEICIYNLEITQVIYGDKPANNTISEFAEEPFRYPETVYPIQCRNAGEGYLLLMADIKLNDDRYRYRCGNSALHSIDKKQEILRLMSNNKG